MREGGKSLGNRGGRDGEGRMEERGREGGRGNKGGSEEKEEEGERGRRTQNVLMHSFCCRSSVGGVSISDQFLNKAQKQHQHIITHSHTFMHIHRHTQAHTYTHTHTWTCAHACTHKH